MKNLAFSHLIRSFYVITIFGGATSLATALDIPGRIEAEDASSQVGTKTENTSDVGGGLNVGRISATDSLSFNTTVQTSGTYLVEFRVATPRSTSSIELRVNGSPAANISVPNTGGWQNWQTISAEINLNSGNQTIELQFGGNQSGDLMNLNWIYAEFVGETVVRMQKQNTGFSIDGANGAKQGQQVYLWTTSSSNVNQQWIESSQGGDFVSFKKNNTNLCLDGGSGGSNGQPVRLQPCNDNNQNQHWRKVELSNGRYRLEKRGTNYSIDGNNGGSKGQSVYLWSSSSNNVNQQWQFFGSNAPTTSSPSPTPNPAPSPSADYELISSIDELHDAFESSNGNYKMAPGYYTLDEILSDGVTILRTTGNNNVYDFTDVTIDMPTELISQMKGQVHTFAEWKIEGNNNTFINGTFVNTYPDGEHSVTDFRAHNQNSASGRAPGRSSTFMRIWGDNNKFYNNTIIVRGSFPYGYGEIYGKGNQNEFGLRKHSGIQIVGDNSVIDGLNHTQLAFGHGIFIQGADNTVIRNSSVQGEVRLGADMYDDGEGSLPDQSGYLQYHPSWRFGPIPEDRVFALTEDGIRAYGSGTKLDGTKADTGSVVVENTTVKNLRSCIALVSASEAYVNNVEVRGCEDAFSIPGGSEVADSRADAAFGHLIGMPYGESNGTFDITLIEPEYQSGDHYLTNIAGSGHNIIIRSDGNTPAVTRRIVVGFAWDRWDHPDSFQQHRHNAEDIHIVNLTDHDLELTEHASDITGSSVGHVIDDGDNNDIE